MSPKRLLSSHWVSNNMALGPLQTSVSMASDETTEATWLSEHVKRWTESTFNLDKCQKLKLNFEHLQLIPLLNFKKKITNCTTEILTDAGPGFPSLLPLAAIETKNSKETWETMRILQKDSKTKHLDIKNDLLGYQPWPVLWLLALRPLNPRTSKSPSGPVLHHGKAQLLPIDAAHPHLHLKEQKEHVRRLLVRRFGATRFSMVRTRSTPLVRPPYECGPYRCSEGSVTVGSWWLCSSTVTWLLYAVITSFVPCYSLKDIQPTSEGNGKEPQKRQWPVRYFDLKK